jgi:hypothetical protein
VGRDLSGREAFCAQRQHNLINTGQPALALLDDLRIERRAGVPWHVDLYRPDLGQHGLRAGTVAGVPAPSRGHVVLFVAEVLVHFRFQSSFQDVLGEPVQKPVRADEIDALLLGLGQELLR